MKLLNERPCPLCQAFVKQSESIVSSYSKVEFQTGICEVCRLGIVINPRIDFENLYDESYYQGTGADPWVRYSDDLDANSIRRIEFNGILETISNICDARGLNKEEIRILDYGSGTGSLRNFLSTSAGLNVDVYDSSNPASHGLLKDSKNAYDLIVAIEVIEHLLNPLEELTNMFDLLRAGGVLFVTTGNLAKARGGIKDWYYAQIPDVHITFWTPFAWDKALNLSGFATSSSTQIWSRDIIWYKLAKRLGLFGKLVGSITFFKPLIVRQLDRRLGFTAFNLGIKPIDK